MKIGHLTPNWTESISCWCFAQMFSHFRGPSIVGQGATGSLGPPQGWVPKQPSKLYKQMFRQQNIFTWPQDQAVSQLFSTFPCTYSILCLSRLAISHFPSFFLPEFIPCVVREVETSQSYLSDPKQIFHGSIQSNLTQWGTRNRIKGAL